MTEPLLAVSSRWSERAIVFAGVALLVGFVAFVAGTLLTIELRAATFGLPDSGTRRGLVVEMVLYGCACSTIGALICAIATHLDRVSGRAVFDEDGLTIEKAFLGNTGAYRVEWSELATFDDDHPGYVRVRRREPKRFDEQRLTIPTRDEQARCAVLEILSSRGIARAC